MALNYKLEVRAISTRKTKQKEAIRAAFTGADRPLSHEEALAIAGSNSARLSLATVYRNVNLLVEEQWLTPVEVPGSATRYEVSGKEHHHHFQCKRCGRLFELAGCEIELRSALPPGFRTTGHEFFVFGLCDSCV